MRKKMDVSITFDHSLPEQYKDSERCIKILNPNIIRVEMGQIVEPSNITCLDIESNAEILRKVDDDS